MKKKSIRAEYIRIYIQGNAAQRKYHRRRYIPPRIGWNLRCTRAHLSTFHLGNGIYKDCRYLGKGISYRGAAPLECTYGDAIIRLRAYGKENLTKKQKKLNLLYCRGLEAARMHETYLDFFRRNFFGIGVKLVYIFFRRYWRLCHKTKFKRCI